MTSNQKALSIAAVLIAIAAIWFGFMQQTEPVDVAAPDPADTVSEPGEVVVESVETETGTGDNETADAARSEVAPDAEGGGEVAGVPVEPEAGAAEVAAEDGATDVPAVSSAIPRAIASGCQPTSKPGPAGGGSKRTRQKRSSRAGKPAWPATNSTPSTSTRYRGARRRNCQRCRSSLRDSTNTSPR